MANGAYLNRRRSLAGPTILIGIGVLFLLANIGLLNRARLWWWFGTYWPLLLILIGVVRLVEYMAARRSGVPTPRFGGGGIVLLILFIMIGIGATQSRRVNWDAFNENVDINTDFGGMFGQKYDFNEEQEQDIGAARSIQIDSERGTVKVHPQDAKKVKLVIHRRVAAESQDEANKVNAENKASIAVDGDTLHIRPSRPEATVHIGFYGGPRVATDIEVWAPRNLPVNVSAGRGDVVIEGRAGNLTLTTTHGDIQVRDIKGNVSLTNRHGSVQASNVDGDVAVNGRLDNTDLSQVTGGVTLDGDFFGETKLTKIAKAVRFTSSRTQMQLEKLDGDLQMDSGDLRATSLTGPFTLRTKSKDVHLENVTGDVTVENSHAEVEVHPNSAAGNIEVRNRQGAIHLVLPTNAGFNVNARTNYGDIETDFDLSTGSVGHESTATGNIGKGGPRLLLTTEHGVIEIRKG